MAKILMILVESQSPQQAMSMVMVWMIWLLVLMVGVYVAHRFSFLCCMCFILCWFCLSSSCFLCTQYCQFLWIVYSWFPHRFPITFLDIWFWNCSNCVYFHFLILLEVSIIIFCPKSNDLKQQIPPPYSSALISCYCTVHVYVIILSTETFLGE